MIYVRYVESCTPKVRYFKSKLMAAKFVANFKLKYQHQNEDDNWIDMVFKGELIYTEPALKVSYLNGKSGKKTNKGTKRS